MDPDAALATLTDGQEMRDDRLDAGLALVRWIARGGSIPAGLSYTNRSRYAAARSLAAIAEVVELIERSR